MSDDFGTVSVGRGDRAREIEAMRGKYRTHREELQKLAADAPTDHLATEYERLLGDIDAALLKLDELDTRKPTGSGSMPIPPSRVRTSAGEMPLATPPRSTMADDSSADSAGGAANPTSRVAIIVIAGLIVLGAIVWLIWRGSERHGAPAPVAEQPSTVTPTETAAPSTAATEPSIPNTTATEALVKVTPVIADYGTIQKGTRAVRQFEVMNNGSKTITVQVSRSACRCLYYDYHDKVGPKKKETITVTVDGAKAKEGTLHETLAVTSKENRSVSAEMTVQAIIK